MAEVEGAKRVKEEEVWIITYTHGIDDYKPRGRSVRSEVIAYVSWDLCQQDLKKRVIEKVNERLKNCDKCPEEIMEYLKGYGDEEQGVKKPYEVDPFAAWDLHDVDNLYEYIAKGEFIEYKWTYDIASYVIRDTLAE
jgi:hypothetical protein